MSLFCSAILTLKHASLTPPVELLLPGLLRQYLRQITPDTSPSIALEYRIVKAFLNIKRHSHYYATIGRNIPCLRTFKENIDLAIRNKIFFNSSQMLSDDFLFETSLNLEEMKICAEYYLMKAKIWTPENQNYIDEQSISYSLIKNMSLLLSRSLLTQDNFNFIARSAQQAQDITYALAALEMKSWLNHTTISQIRSHYKPRLGEVIFSLICSEAGQRNRAVKLTAQARTILDLSAQRKNPAHISATLKYFAKKDTVIQLTEDQKYLKSAKKSSYGYNTLLTRIEQNKRKSSYFEEFNPQNNLSLLDLMRIRFLSALHLEKLANELHLLRIPLGRFVFDANFFSTLITTVQHQFFESKQSILEFLEANHCLDAHIIFALYKMNQHENARILSTITWLLSRPEFTEKHLVIRFYFECHAPDLSEVMSNSSFPILPWSILIRIDPHSKKIIDCVRDKNPAILTSSFLYELQYKSLVYIMNWALKRHNTLPWQQLNDNDFITLSQLSQAKEIVQILDDLQSPISFHFFSFMISSKKRSKSFKEVVSVLPMLKAADLIQPSNITALITYLERQHTYSGPSYIITAMHLLSPDSLDAPLFRRLIRDKEIEHVRQVATHIEAILDPVQKQSSKNEFTRMIKAGRSFSQIMTELQQNIASVSHEHQAYGLLSFF